MKIDSKQKKYCILIFYLGTVLVFHSANFKTRPRIYDSGYESTYGSEETLLACDADCDELRAKVARRGVAAGVGPQVLVVARHDALLRRQEVRVHAAVTKHGPFIITVSVLTRLI